MDANAIVMELEYFEIISNGDQTTIWQNKHKTQQNQYLHACLMRTCTMKALMSVCHIITKVKGNPKMQSLGNDMKTELEKGHVMHVTFAYVSECVYSCVHACMCIRYYTTILIQD